MYKNRNLNFDPTHASETFHGSQARSQVRHVWELVLVTKGIAYFGRHPCLEVHREKATALTQEQGAALVAQCCNRGPPKCERIGH
jgi:hypothetical protein